MVVFGLGVECWKCKSLVQGVPVPLLPLHCKPPKKNGIRNPTRIWNGESIVSIENEGSDLLATGSCLIACGIAASALVCVLDSQASK
jgi:hypothetical protein